MITLNTEQGLTKAFTWSDIVSLPGFVSNLDAEKSKLKEVRGRYTFPDKINCGLKSCHSPHLKGYVVSTFDGYTTNIGHICGKNFFGIDFVDQSREFDARVDEQENREVIQSFVDQYGTHDKELESILNGPRGAKWVQRMIKYFSSRDNMPKSALDIILKASIRDGKIYTERALSVAEREASRSTGGHSSYVEEQIGFLTGIEVVDQEKKLRDVLAKDLVVNSDKVVSLEIHQLTRKELNYWSKWISEYRNKIDVVNGIIKAAIAFYSVANLSPIADLLNDDEDKSFLRGALSVLK